MLTHKRSRQGLLYRLFLLASLGLAACSNNAEPPLPEPAVEDAAATSGPDAASPSIDDVLPRPYREVWAEWTGDLDGMIERRMIRVVTPYGGYMYYFDDGEPRGATWELTNRFERQLNDDLGRRNVRVFVVVIPLSRDQLIPALLEGHADIIAADLTMTELRSAQLAFTRPLLKDINEVIVTGPGAGEIAGLDDLAGREIHVRRASSYYEHLEALVADMRTRGLEPPSIVPLDELLESEDIMDMLNAGIIDMTVMDDYKARFWAKVFPETRVRDDLVINEGGSIAWVTRKDSPQLLETLNGFLRKYGRGTLVGNDTYNRYLADASELRCTRTIADDDRLQALSAIFREYGEQYGFDWLKVAAQAYQESKFDQSKTSNAGAVGIMQIKPSTAEDPNVGIADVSTVENNVHAGIKYLRFIADRYFSDESIDDLNRWLLSLAAYNAGPARVIRLRREAEENGYDPDIWFDNVEIIAARRIGSETITYVSNIFKYYSGYQMASAKLDERRKRFELAPGGCIDGG